mmetsp:Transcript_146255/g.469090  ORF Transcript_146255/g.469090 Transcript_146255/m.469090 type:complete len:534 (-) Transcript_146255:266-1867(-)
MAIRRCPALDKKYIFEYDVGMWTYGTVQVLKDRETSAIKTCKVVKKSTLQFTSDVLPRLKSLQDLQHPHICSITDVIEDKDNFYIVSDFFQGGDVQDWMERMDEGNWLQEATCAAYIRQAILAIAHSHGAQVHHGDLRPSNLVLTSKLPDATIKVCDFGLAAILDPDNRILQSQPSQYTVPEIVQGSQDAVRNGAVDIWSVGAIAHALLTGRAPGENSMCAENAGWNLARKVRQQDDEAWSERSDVSRDFVRRCLRRNGERPTGAKLLWHPWLKGMSPLTTHMLRADTDVAREIRHKTLCYTLAVILLPVVVPYKDFEQLRMCFQQSDSDQDGLISRSSAQRLLLGRRDHVDAVIPALSIVDVAKTDVLDLCATACADLIVRDFFANGPTSQPLCGPFRATDLAPKMLNLFFQTFGSRANQGGGTCQAETIRNKIRTATLREVELHTNVVYEELLACLPEDSPIDSQMLTTHLCQNAGRGTPLGTDGEMSPLGPENAWTLSGKGAGFFELSSFFQSCGMGAKRDDSPHSLRIA